MANQNEELKKSVMDVLARDTRIDEKEINVRVEEGAVFVEGTVDSAAERKAAVLDIQRTPGVKSVVDYLRLRNYIERTDSELEEAVKQDLMRDPYVDPATIGIRAHAGEIKLQGRVRTYAEKHAAENVTLWTPGVTDMISDLEVEEEEELAEEPIW